MVVNVPPSFGKFLRGFVVSAVATDKYDNNNAKYVAIVTSQCQDIFLSLLEATNFDICQSHVSNKIPTSSNFVSTTHCCPQGSWAQNYKYLLLLQKNA